jgi:hypothetical protein
VLIRGDHSIAEGLWEWADSQALLFEFPTVGTTAPSKSALEVEAERLRSARLRLEEPSPDKEARLTLIEPSALALPQGMRLEVCRYTTPGEVVLFPNGASSVNLPGCKRALRTQFVVCSLFEADECIAWTSQVEMVPGLDDQRDRELVAQLLGPRDFLAYLQSLRSDDSLAGPIEGSEEIETPLPHLERSGRSQDLLSLEGLLRQLAEEPEAFAEMDQAIRRYGDLIKSGPLAEDERSVFSEFMDAWNVIREASAT